MGRRAKKTTGHRLDGLDVAIMLRLQEHGPLKLGRLATMIERQSPACRTRLRHLKKLGFIGETIVPIDVEKVTGTNAQRNPSWRLTPSVHFEFYLVKAVLGDKKTFENRVCAMPEAVGFWRVRGEFEYIVHLVFRDMQRSDSLTDELKHEFKAEIQACAVKSPALKSFKSYPLSVLQLPGAVPILSDPES